MHFREKKTPYYWTELFYVFLHLCVWHTGLQWHNWLVLMSILSCWFFLYRWFLIGKCNLFSFVLKKNTNQWQMWKNYLKKAKNDWKGLFIDVLFVKKKKKSPSSVLAPSSCHRDFTVKCNDSYFVVDIFFGNPLLNLELCFLKNVKR